MVDERCKAEENKWDMNNIYQDADYLCSDVLKIGIVDKLKLSLTRGNTLDFCHASMYSNQSLQLHLNQTHTHSSRSTVRSTEPSSEMMCANNLRHLQLQTILLL